MPVERQTWRSVKDWDRANAQLDRAHDVFTASDRVAVLSVSATATLALTYPHTLVLATTTGGNVTLTLPAAATVPGFRVECKKLTAANTLTLAAAAGETIDGAGTLAWATQYQSYSVIADGGAWYVV
jgi:hypothetical protein